MLQPVHRPTIRHPQPPHLVFHPEDRGGMSFVECHDFLISRGVTDIQVLSVQGALWVIVDNARRCAKPETMMQSVAESVKLSPRVVRKH